MPAVYVTFPWGSLFSNASLRFLLGCWKRLRVQGVLELVHQEIERRKYKTEEEKDALVPMLRDVSRQEYLKKREEQKLQELEDALKDEEFLFAVCSLAEHEFMMALSFMSAECNVSNSRCLHSAVHAGLALSITIGFVYRRRSN